MGSNSANKPHAVCVPFPAQGHVNPVMQLAKLLHSRGFYITFVNTEFNHRRLLRSKGYEWVNGFDDFKFETIPEGLLLVDFAINKYVQVYTVNKLINLVVLPFMMLDENFMIDGTLDTKVDWIPGMIRDLRLKDLPAFMRTTDPNNVLFTYARDEAQNCFKASAMIFNTLEPLEHEVLQALSSMFPHIYPIGPLSLLLKDLPNSPLYSFRSSFWKEDTKCLEWLDKREPNSVVYVNYGSLTLMTDQHLKEFAWGLANSKQPFLWIVRPDIVMGDSAILSEDFLEEIKDRGLLASWCPQDEVLSHESIGVFLTHCGWNSTLESICEGVPIICWPFFAEQQTNCLYSCSDDQWGIGVEVNQDVKREEIEALAKEMMEGEKGKKLKKKALEWKKKAEEATSTVGGSSYSSFDRFIKDALHYNV